MLFYSVRFIPTEVTPNARNVVKVDKGVGILARELYKIVHLVNVYNGDYHCLFLAREHSVAGDDGRTVLELGKDVFLEFVGCKITDFRQKKQADLGVLLQCRCLVRHVLILVLVDYSGSQRRESKTHCNPVLILVIVDYSGS